jgi:hypothetical protein
MPHARRPASQIPTEQETKLAGEAILLETIDPHVSLTDFAKGSAVEESLQDGIAVRIGDVCFEAAELGPIVVAEDAG